MSVNLACFCGKIQIHNAVTVQCYVGSSHSTCKLIIIVSVLNEVKWLVCLFHSDSHILIDQGTYRRGYYRNKNGGGGGGYDASLPSFPP